MVSSRVVVMRKAGLDNAARSAQISSRKVIVHDCMPRVLVVDDLAAARQAIVALLALEGFDVRAAASGPEAVDLVREWPPHVVVLDVTMPEHDGFAVAAVLRGLRSTAEAVIVATTGYDIDELKAKGPIENFDALFLKGEDGALLTTLIRTAIVQKGEAA